MTERTWPSDWEARRSGDGCVACTEGRPDRVPNGERIFAGSAADAYLLADTAVRGYVVLFWRGRHVVELADLTAPELETFTRELASVCRAIEALYSPAKLNLLLLGNSLPHLHAHIVPRYVDDPDPGRPPRFMMEEHIASPVEPADYLEQLEALRARLTS